MKFCLIDKTRLLYELVPIEMLDYIIRQLVK